MDKRLILYYLSDSSGETAHRVAIAAASYFERELITIHRLPKVDTIAEMEHIVESVEAGSVICFTLGDHQLTQTLESLAPAKNITLINVLSKLVDTISEKINVAPKPSSSSFYELDENYYKRLEAVNFAIKYDDGKILDGFNLADIVILGPSRSSKTPIAMYIAQHYGSKVLNYPLIYGLPIPDLLYNISVKKIVGLKIKPEILFQIRQKRLERMDNRGSLQSNYADLEYIYTELDFIDSVYKKLGCITVDVSLRGIEEISAEIIKLLKLK